MEYPLHRAVPRKVLPLTREWIEISCCGQNIWKHRCSPSYEGVDWNDSATVNFDFCGLFSLLRGSGLKSYLTYSVSTDSMFSLLRGSGLKSFVIPPITAHWCSPSYEGVDWNSSKSLPSCDDNSSPSYEGVDWNIVVLVHLRSKQSSPSYEGVDWNVVAWRQTAEFISSPSYEGVDWNGANQTLADQEKVLPLTREWIEIQLGKDDHITLDTFSLLRGSGLK